MGSLARGTMPRMSEQSDDDAEREEYLDRKEIEAEAALTVVCPRCSAHPGIRCRQLDGEKRGDPREEPHRQRVLRARSEERYADDPVGRRRAREGALALKRHVEERKAARTRQGLCPNCATPVSVHEDGRTHCSWTQDEVRAAVTEQREKDRHPFGTGLRDEGESGAARPPGSDAVVMPELTREEHLLEDHETGRPFVALVASEYVLTQTGGKALKAITATLVRTLNTLLGFSEDQVEVVVGPADDVTGAATVQALAPFRPCLWWDGPPDHVYGVCNRFAGHPGRHQERRGGQLWADWSGGSPPERLIELLRNPPTRGTLDG